MRGQVVHHQHSVGPDLAQLGQQYRVQVVRADGSSNLLWVDRNYGPYGDCSLVDGPLPGPAFPTTFDLSTFVLLNGYAYSGALPGAASTGYVKGF